MTKRTAEEWGRLAVSLPGWRWMSGMLRIVPPEREGATGYMVRVVDSGWSGSDRGFPDLTDPATLGCLLALVREVAQEPGLHVRCMLPYAPDMGGKTPPPWVLHSGRGHRWGDRHDTEAAALVAALEAAP